MGEPNLENIKTSRDAKAAGLPVFKVLSDGAIKAYKDDQGVRRFTITASSDVDDLVGDVFAKKALDRLQSTAKGMTMFLNHSYNVPGDVFGSVEEAVVGRKKVFNRVLGEDVECWCLTYHGIVTEVNPAAVQTHDMMMEGVVTLGASVSVLIVQKSKTDNGGKRIEDALNLECSIVGLPCNPTSWVESASKALKLTDLLDDPVPDTKGCPKCSKSVDTLHDFTREACPHCKWLATPGRVAEMIAAATDGASGENHTSSKAGEVGLPVITNQTDGEAAAPEVVNQEKIMKDGYSFHIARKGMFNEVKDKNESSIYHLVDLLTSALYNLYYDCVYYEKKDVDPEAELTLICEEFEDVVKARLLPRLKGDDESADKSVEAVAARAAKNLTVISFLAHERAVAKTAEALVKAGSRNSAADQKMIESIHDLTLDLGAACKQPEAATDDKAAPGADKTASLASGEVKDASALRQEIDSLQKRLTATESAAEKALEVAEAAAAEKEHWKASSLAALAALEEHGLQPIPRNQA